MNDRFIIPEGKSVKLKDYSSALTKPYGSKAEADEKLKKANNEFPVQPLAPIFPAGRMVARQCESAGGRPFASTPAPRWSSTIWRAICLNSMT
ncbi:MAG: hypothetical protein HY288_12850 [Planctomycetia bacterium]|nr:hypothetical protein [Planctomycetia bacterium]